jgi:hypothetical protein
MASGRLLRLYTGGTEPPRNETRSRANGFCTLHVRWIEEAAEYSRVRLKALAQWRGSFGLDSLAWVVPPVLNGCTRVAGEMCPPRGIFRAVGYERIESQKIVEPVTLPSCLNRDSVSA